MDKNNGKQDEVQTTETQELEFNNDLEYSRTPVPTITDPKDVHNWVLQLQKFIKLCEQPPRVIKAYKVGSTSFRYVPIDAVETAAKELFMGLIDEDEPHFQVIGNEIVATQKIKVFHPIAGVWIGVVGWAAVQIRMKKDTDHTDPRNKVVNALQLDFPHLGAECFKNAMQRLGRKFGRGLRRDYLDEYQPLVESLQDKARVKKHNENSDKVLEEYKGKVDHFKATFSNPDKLKAQAFQMMEEAKKKGLDDVDVALLKNYIDQTVREWK